MAIPVFCFCMPCLIRFLARFQHLNAPKGAEDSIINTIPLISVTEAESGTCPICLSDMNLGEQARNLPCHHIFHKNVIILFYI